jgi:alpha-kinase
MAESSAYLKVKEAKVSSGSPPKIVQALESAQVHANTDYTLECIMTGEPEPTITWFKDDVEIIEPSDAYNITKFVNLRQLTIKNAQPDRHGGKYTCKAQNDYGSADCSCIVVVKRKL